MQLRSKLTKSELQLRRGSLNLSIDNKSLLSPMVNQPIDSRRNSTLGLSLEEQRFSHNLDFDERDRKLSSLGEMSLADILNDNSFCSYDSQSDKTLTCGSPSSPSFKMVDLPKQNNNPTWLKSPSSFFSLSKWSLKGKKSKGTTIMSRRGSRDSVLDIDLFREKIRNNPNFDDVLSNGFLNEKETKPTLKISLTPKVAKSNTTYTTLPKAVGTVINP